MSKKLTSIVISAGLLLGMYVTGGDATAAPTSSVTLSRITATFQQAEFATHYTAQASDRAKKALTFTWTLKLQLVDKAGANNPGIPGSKAAVDGKCNNGGKLTSSTKEFIWKHGDAGLGNCDHSTMGPSGHQGLVTLVVSDGLWSCTATYGGTNSGVGPVSMCKPIATPAKTTVTCTGPTIKLLDNSNGGGVLGGGKQPSFITKGVSYCLMQLITYHWNNGQGAKPGSIGLNGSAGAKLGPWPASGSAGQGNAANVNWTANVSTPTKPVVINGVYSCVDSDPATWSQDVQSHGTGFCQVYVVKAVTSQAATTPKTKASAKASAKPTKPASNSPAAAKCKGTKLSLRATPDNGMPPLKVTFAMCSPKSVQWRIDYGDGKSKVAIGTPPTSITHTYATAGGYKPRLTTIASQAATTSSSVSTNVSVGAALMSLSANPASGASPLKVTFGLATTVTNITSWTLDFGDGQNTAGGGKPPASVSHTYGKDGTYKATFSVKPGAYALVYTVAQITVGSGTPPILGVTATPTSGTHPLAVKFTIGTTIPGVIVSWVMKFGDGYQQQGNGKPPASVSHTYSKKGTFLAYLLVSQQQQYGGVQYVVPRNGLAIQVK